MINVEDHLPLAKKVAGKMHNNTILKYRFEYDDVLQECCVALVKCAKRFDESKGFAFSTYAIKTMELSCLRMLRDDKFYPKSPTNKDTWGNTFTSLDEPVKDDVEKLTPLGHLIGIEDDYSDIDFKIFFDSLSVQEKKIIALRANEIKQSEVAEKLGISQAQVSRLLVQLKQKLNGTFISKTKDKITINVETSERNKAILELINQGFSQKEIGSKFGIKQSAVSLIIKKMRCLNGTA